jgi:hypothetical protein
MDATTYTGTGSNTAISNADAGSTGFKPDFVWIKSRSNSTQHSLYDVIRGIGNTLETNSTSSASQESAGYSLTSFNSNGFNVGTDNALAGSTNSSGYTYVAWQWQAGAGTTSTNTNGSITSTVSVNAAAGFSVIKATIPNSGTSGTIGHGLGVTPAMYVVKYATTGGDWRVYHTSLGQGQYLVLNTNATAASSTTVWNNTAPTSSVLSLGSNYLPDASNNNLAIYAWAQVAGFSQFGSYTGNGSTDGPFIYTGFRPKFILLKRTDNPGDWWIQDTARSPYNTASDLLLPDSSATEYNTSGYELDINSNGFKFRNSHASDNNSGSAYIYAAWAENPFKFSNAR